jgi:hypothetical protein
VVDPHPAISIFNFHYATPPDTIAWNAHLRPLIGDNETGFRGTADLAYRTEGWDFILAGGGLYNNLDYSFTVGHEDGTFAFPRRSRAAAASRCGGSSACCAGSSTASISEGAAGAELVVGGVPPAGSVQVLAQGDDAFGVYLRATRLVGPPAAGAGGRASGTCGRDAGGRHMGGVVDRSETGRTTRRRDSAHGGGARHRLRAAWADDLASISPRRSAMIRVALPRPPSDDPNDALPSRARDLIVPRRRARLRRDLAITLHDAPSIRRRCAAFAREHGVRLLRGVRAHDRRKHVCSQLPADAARCGPQLDDLAALKAAHPTGWSSPRTRSTRFLGAGPRALDAFAALGRRRGERDARRGLDWNREAIAVGGRRTACRSSATATCTGSPSWGTLERGGRRGAAGDARRRGVRTPSARAIRAGRVPRRRRRRCRVAGARYLRADDRRHPRPFPPRTGAALPPSIGPDR